MDKQMFDSLLKDKTAQIEQVLYRYLPTEQGFQKTVIEAMNYSLTVGGKRLRPLLMQETYQMCGGKPDSTIEAFMAAIEMIHTYSLVHDDLPAMDNDEYRRGRKTTWKVYGDAFGILAGDGLLNFAFETAIGTLEYGTMPASVSEEENAGQISLKQFRKISRALAVLGRKAGIYGMIGGQTADIEAETEESAITQETLLFIHEHKTAALIQASMMIGAILAGAGEEEILKIEKCAYNIGIAFQIQDDILDVIGDSEELGKTTGSDAQNNKQTYVTLKGLEESKKDVAKLSEEAVAILDEFEGEREFLTQLVLTLIHRRK